METFLLIVRHFARSHIEDDEPLVSHFADGIARTFTANAVPRPFLVLADMPVSRPSRPVIRPFPTRPLIPEGGVASNNMKPYLKMRHPAITFVPLHIRPLTPADANLSLAAGRTGTRGCPG